MPHRASLVAATATEVLRKSNVIASSARAIAVWKTLNDASRRDMSGGSHRVGSLTNLEHECLAAAWVRRALMTL